MESTSSESAASSFSFLASYSKFVIYLVVFLIVLYLVVLYRRRNQKRDRDEPMLLPNPEIIGKVKKPFAGSLLPMSSSGMEYSYSFWMYVNDWNYNYGKPKCVLFRSSQGVHEYSKASPSIWLYPKENKLMVRLSTMVPDQEYDSNTYPQYQIEDRYTVVNPLKMDKKLFDTKFSCDVENIPLQKWVHVAVTLWNRTLDVYINGKLARSCVLPGVPLQPRSEMEKLFVGHGDTYNGYISRLKYYNRSISSQEVYDLYKDGPLPPSAWYSVLKDRINVLMTFS